MESRNQRLLALAQDTRYISPPKDMEVLSRYVDYAKLNSIEGLAELCYYVMECLEQDKLHKVIEVGCHLGVSTECLALFCDELAAVDPWPVTHIYHQFLRRMRGYEHVNVNRKKSPLAAIDYDDHSFDLVYLDGLHTRQAVEADIYAWIPKVRPGGFIAGHDYADYSGCYLAGHMQVISAVDGILGRPDMIFSDTSWIKQL
jgi:predicted O-methyltransferase YrrM